MGRWEPDAHGRLVEAALELYSERGFEGTTVAEIAKKAGLTERTFFRHFADKREVLFRGAELLEQQLVREVENAPDSLAPIDAIGRALEAVAADFPVRSEHARRRQEIIAATPELQERERIKLASLATALAGALRRRGVKDSAADLAAEMGVAVFRISFERWAHEKKSSTLLQVVRDLLAELKAVNAGT
jgi:AcrR family transcriptional regulator